MPREPRGFSFNFDGEAISTEEWGKLFELARRTGANVVRKTEIGQYGISTVWIGLDLSPLYDVPLIYETMIFGPEPFGGETYRYPDRAHAVAGHKDLVSLLVMELGLEPIEVHPNAY